MQKVKSFKVASAQILIVAGDPQANLKRAILAIRDAKAQGADFVVLPECSNYGWADASAIDGAVEVENDPFILRLQKVAADSGIYVAVGFVERHQGLLFNAAVLIGASGELLSRHRKINELDFAKEIYSTGSIVSVAETPFGKVGLMICADALSKSDEVIERLVALGCNLILSPSAWAVPPSHNNTETPYGSLWLDAYRKGLGSSKTWIVATSNVGTIASGAWANFACIGNSIAIGPGDDDLIISPFGQDAVHTQIVIVNVAS